jgi:hypothetical protein
VYLLVLRDCAEMVDYMSNRKAKLCTNMALYYAVVIVGRVAHISSYFFL